MGTSAAKASGDIRAAGPLNATIGLFGGTFDPVHFGHLRIALDACEQLGLDQVRFIPLAEAVHREQPQAPAVLRAEMLHEATKGHPQLVVDEREMRRAGPSYTVDTVSDMAQAFPKATLCLLVGSDAFASFMSWRSPQRILELTNLAVLQRPGESAPRNGALADLLSRHGTASLQPGHTGQILRLKVTQLDIASSDIRERIRGQRSPAFLLPGKVLALIEKHGLYRPG